MQTLLRRIAGVVLVVIGLLALVTPFTPGSWLALVGLELLGFELIFAKKVQALLARYHARFFPSTTGALMYLVLVLLVVLTFALLYFFL